MFEKDPFFPLKALLGLVAFCIFVGLGVVGMTKLDLYVGKQYDDAFSKRELCQILAQESYPCTFETKTSDGHTFVVSIDNGIVVFPSDTAPVVP